MLVAVPIFAGQGSRFGGYCTVMEQGPQNTIAKAFVKIINLFLGQKHWVTVVFAQFVGDLLSFPFRQVITGYAWPPDPLIFLDSA